MSISDYAKSLQEIKKSRILVTGANGFIGKRLIRSLLPDSDVIGSVRSHNSSFDYIERTEKFESIVVGDLSEKTDWSSALSGVEVVVHLAGRAHHTGENPSQSRDLYRSVNCDASVNLLRQAAKSSVKRFIFMSSIGVIGNASGTKPFNEDTECCPVAAYAHSKLEAEIALTKIAEETGIELVIIRPPLVYGDGAPGNFGKLSRLVSKVPILPFGAVHNRKSFISIDNLVDFIEVCITHPSAANERFVIADDDVISTKKLIDYIACSLDKSVLQLPFPVSVFRLLLKVVGKQSLSTQLFDDLEVDTSKAKSLLSWQAKVSTVDSLQQTFTSR